MLFSRCLHSSSLTGTALHFNCRPFEIATKARSAQADALLDMQVFACI
jgi:hypothetical protein